MPEVLRKYIPGNPDFISYTKELPKDTTSAKIKGKAHQPETHFQLPGEIATAAMSGLKI